MARKKRNTAVTISHSDERADPRAMDAALAIIAEWVERASAPEERETNEERNEASK